MANKYVYQIVGGSLGDINVVKNNHFVDVGQGCHTSSACTDDFLNAVKGAGLAPMCLSGNDGYPTCDETGGEACAQALASKGWVASGGESTGQGEIAYTQKHMTFETWGGSYGEGDLDPFSQWRIGTGPFPNMVCYLEPYTNYNMYVQNTINICAKAWGLGCWEVGVLVAYGKGSLQDYINIANGVIAASGKFSGFCFWNGCISVCSDTINAMSNIVQGLQAKFPPDDRPMDVRRKGVVGPTPKPPKDYSGIYTMLFE